MPSKYIKRTLEPVLLRALQEFPGVVLTGPRQSGKTTLLKHVLESRFKYVSLDPPDVRHSAASDPRGFLELHPSPVIFDEIQNVPDLLPYIKEKIDSHRDRSGQYMLTGSQNLFMMEQISETLAGRVAVLRILPLSRHEKIGSPERPMPWQAESATPAHSRSSVTELWNDWLRGGFPELAVSPERDVALWHASYIQTYLERDVRMIRQVGDLAQFQAFLRALAARNGQLLHLSEMARDLGIAVNTIKTWLSVLESTYQVVVIRPYFANVGKRLVKTPKVYFTDTGTLCYLTGLRDSLHAAGGPMGGAIFETAVLMEIYKNLVHLGEDPQIYFWRTSTGDEVDFIVENRGKVIPIEVKSTATPRPEMTKNIQQIRSLLSNRIDIGYLIHAGETVIPLGEGIRSLSFYDL